MVQLTGFISVFSGRKVQMAGEIGGCNRSWVHAKRQKPTISQPLCKLSRKENVGRLGLGICSPFFVRLSFLYRWLVWTPSLLLDS